MALVFQQIRENELKIVIKKIKYGYKGNKERQGMLGEKLESNCDNCNEMCSLNSWQVVQWTLQRDLSPNAKQLSIGCLT